MSKSVDLAEKLKQAGYKLTRSRLAVLETLETHPEHLDHAQILKAGRHIYPHLSRATVYRTMELLVELNLFRPLYLSDPTQRFVSAAGGHHHLVCTKCGTIYEFENCHADQLMRELAEKYHFLILNHLVEFQGLCENCQQYPTLER
jgi:Fur family ferric uptake transcriptional regulator